MLIHSVQLRFLTNNDTTWTTVTIFYFKTVEIGCKIFGSWNYIEWPPNLKNNTGWILVGKNNINHPKENMKHPHVWHFDLRRPCIDAASLDMMKGNGGTVLLVTLKSRNWTKYVGLDTFDQL